MIEQVSAIIALCLMVIFFIILFYIDISIKQIFKDVDCDKKPLFLYAKIKYLSGQKSNLTKPLQKKLDRVVLCQKVIYALFFGMFCLYLIGNIFK